MFRGKPTDFYSILGWSLSSSRSCATVPCCSSQNWQNMVKKLCFLSQKHLTNSRLSTARHSSRAQDSQQMISLWTALMAKAFYSLPDTCHFWCKFEWLLHHRDRKADLGYSWNPPVLYWRCIHNSFLEKPSLCCSNLEKLPKKMRSRLDLPQGNFTGDDPKLCTSVQLRCSLKSIIKAAGIVFNLELIMFCQNTWTFTWLLILDCITMLKPMQVTGLLQ